MTIRYICKTCGAETPPGIGYALLCTGDPPAPDPTCPGPHLQGDD